MPAGRGKQCEDCYWRALFRKRIQMDRAIFAKSNVADRYITFADWLESQVGPHKAAITVNRYVTFFAEMEKRWGGIPKYTVLLQHFGAAGLRRAELPMRWLIQTGQAVIDGAAKDIDSERRRIEHLLEGVGEDPDARAILAAYRKRLECRVESGKTSLRSVRLALSPAAGLLRLARERGVMPPDQQALNTFLQRVPGQRAALSGFIGYLRDHSVDLTLPKPNGLGRYKRRKRLERELMLLFANDRHHRMPQRRFIEIALEYFHDLTAGSAKRIAAKGEFRMGEDGAGSVVFDNQEYVIPLALPSGFG